MSAAFSMQPSDILFNYSVFGVLESFVAGLFLFLLAEHTRCHRSAELFKAGGHDEPAEKIVSRYERSLRNLSQLVRIADHTRVIDNSDREPHLICEVVNQHLTIWETEQWSKSAILRLFSGRQK